MQQHSSSSSESDYAEFASPARDFQTRITHIVLDGAKATEVRDFSDEVRDWLATQPDDEVRRFSVVLRSSPQTCVFAAPGPARGIPIIVQIHESPAQGQG